MHRSVLKYLEDRPEIREDFNDALDSIRACPYPFQNRQRVNHLKGQYDCSYRYALKRGRRGVRFKFEIDKEDRAIDVYYLGPRGGAY